MSEASRYALLKLIQAQPEISQRELAKRVGMSLGKVNYSLKTLVENGFVVLQCFKKNDKKLGYAYLLTPVGIEEKTRIAMNFLRSKETQYASIQEEIATLRQEIDAQKLNMGRSKNPDVPHLDAEFLV